MCSLDSGANAVHIFLTPYRVSVCVCFKCLAKCKKCVFLNFFHSGHENFAFLTCFLISVAIFLIQRNSVERNSHSKLLVLASVVNLYPVLL